MREQLPSKRPFLCVARHHHAVRFGRAPPDEGGREGGKEGGREGGREGLGERARKGRREEWREKSKDVPVEQLAGGARVQETRGGEDDGGLKVIEVADRAAILDESEAEGIGQVHLGREGGREGGKGR